MIEENTHTLFRRLKSRRAARAARAATKQSLGAPPPLPLLVPPLEDELPEELELLEEDELLLPELLELEDEELELLLDDELELDELELLDEEPTDLVLAVTAAHLALILPAASYAETEYV